MPNNVDPERFSQALQQLIDSPHEIKVTQKQIADLGALLMGEDVFVHPNALNVFAQVLIDRRVTVANRAHNQRLGKRQQAITQNLRNLKQVFAQYPGLLGNEGASMQESTSRMIRMSMTLAGPTSKTRPSTSLSAARSTT